MNKKNGECFSSSLFFNRFFWFQRVILGFNISDGEVVYFRSTVFFSFLTLIQLNKNLNKNEFTLTICLFQFKFQFGSKFKSQTRHLCDSAANNSNIENYSSARVAVTPSFIFQSDDICEVSQTAVCHTYTFSMQCE